MKLEEIGFYTLSDKRAQESTSETSLKRCEIILTDACNFQCRYCRGLREDLKGTMQHDAVLETLRLWVQDGLENVRFSGGEPTLVPNLPKYVRFCKENGVQHIAVSTNGSADKKLYDVLLDAGVNDFSVSLDGGCCAVGDEMSGVDGSWNVVKDNIWYLAQRTYVTVGMVFTEDNVENAVEAVLFADSLGVSDIRVIPSAQYNRALKALEKLPERILDKYPILRYRISNLKNGIPIRGISKESQDKCRLVLDDMAVASGKHFPCIIYMREGGNPIGKVGPHMREERESWMIDHDPAQDPICKEMCLDVCVAFNKKANEGR